MADTATANGGVTLDDDDREIEEMRRQVLEMEQDLARENETAGIAALMGVASPSAADGSLKKSGNSVDGQFGDPSDPASGIDPSAEIVTGDDPDGRSIYVGNVDYGATPEEIQAHFASCGTINRVTILLDKFTGHPKGYAYVEFAQTAHVDAAVVLHESLFRGRLIKVTPKRANVPAFMRGVPRGRGRGGYRGGRGASAHGYSPYGGRPRGRGGRGRGY